MRVRALDSNGDYVCGGGTGDFLVNSINAVAQCIGTALQLWTGQWFLDLSAGVPWMTEVLGRYPAPLYDSVIREAILDAPGVNAITSYSSSVSNRVLTVSVSAQSIYGPLTMTMSVTAPISGGGYGVGPLGENPLGD